VQALKHPARFLAIFAIVLSAALLGNAGTAAAANPLLCFDGTTDTAAARAASAGVDIARGSHGNTTEARDASVRVATAGGLDDVTVETHRSGTQVQVVVSGRAPLMLDLGLARIIEQASAPLERATQP
jgi:hypothetical protein